MDDLRRTGSSKYHADIENNIDYEIQYIRYELWDLDQGKEVILMPSHPIYISNKLY